MNTKIIIKKGTFFARELLAIYVVILTNHSTFVIIAQNDDDTVHDAQFTDRERKTETKYKTSLLVSVCTSLYAKELSQSEEE